MSRVVREGGRVFIEGVRRMSWDTGEMCEFASAFVRALECFGQRVPYYEAAGACGAAFRFALSPDHWNPGNYAVDNICTDPLEPVRRAFRWAGRDLTFRDRGAFEADREAICQSIAGGTPVIASGVVGPSDYSLVTGYDDGGNVLMGWSVYQDIPDDHSEAPDASGYFRKTGWHDITQWFIFPGGQTALAPRRDRVREVLQWAVTLARYPAAEGCIRGLDAYDALAAALEMDAGFPPADFEKLSGRYLGLLCDLMMVDDRRAADDFMRDVAGTEPDLAEHACAAASAYSDTASVRDEIRGLVPEDFSEESIRRLGDKGIRRECADALRRIRAADERAAGHIEECLALM